MYHLCILDMSQDQFRTTPSAHILLQLLQPPIQGQSPMNLLYPDIIVLPLVICLLPLQHHQVSNHFMLSLLPL
jgi:hypothetical protein